jgi:hypothetical protein
MAATRATLQVRVAALAAAIAHVLGWVLPVVNDYRGWQAFRVAFSPVWPFENFDIQPGLILVLSVLSALTNVLFVVVAVVLLLGPARTLQRARAVLWTVAAAALLDLHWPISMGDMGAELENGYFIWVGSFALLTLAALFRVIEVRQRPR